MRGSRTYYVYILTNRSGTLYYETFRDVWSAIAWEKQIKGWVRRKKLDLIATLNPDWQDLSEGWHTAEQLREGNADEHAS